MKKHLKSLILKLLQQKPMSGSQIIEELNEMMGWKPSCGSIYPMLNKIEQDNLATSQLIKGKKIYSLTKNAESYIKQEDKEKKELIQTMEKSYRLLESLYEIDTSFDRDMLKNIKSGNLPFQEIIEESQIIKDELARLQKTGKFKKNVNQIKKILTKTGNELKKL